MNYENFVVNYRRHTHCSRSMGEAYRTAEYCSAITVYPSEWKKAWEQSLELVSVTIFVAIISAITFWALSA